MAQPDSSGNSLRDRFRSRLGLGAAPAAPAAPAAQSKPAAPADSPTYRTGNAGGPQFQQTPAPTNPSYRPGAAAGSPGMARRAFDAVTAADSSGWRRGARMLGRAVTPAAAAAMEVPTAYNEWEETGDLGRSLARSGVRVGGAALGAAAGAAGAGALGIESGPGALVTSAIGQAAGGGLGYLGGNWAADRWLPKRTAATTVAADPSKPSVRLIEPGSDIAPPAPRDRYDNQRLRDRYGAAAVTPEAKPVPAVDPGDPTVTSPLRTRTQGAVIENPHAMSAMDQLSFASKRFKGSPSMRRAAADMILGGEQRKDANRQAELNANQNADAMMARDANLAAEEFAERRFRASAANARLAEDRRAGDLDRQVTREGHLLGVGRRGGGRPEASFADQVYGDAVKTMGPVGAAQLAARMGNLSGEPGENPYDRYAQTSDMLGAAEGVGRHGDRLLGFTNPDFDVTTAKPVDSSLWERTWNPSDPNGLSRFWNPSDVRFEDSSGRRAWGDAASLPRGQTKDTYSIQRQMQEERRRVAEAQRRRAAE